ncbi:D-inositol-3-phosphate glycosyltransferase [Kitasatospora sp. MAA4]|uniref:glycosyltransferase n=1 Tax=Kitasatospora sp. MAA4 TaxID=3035093 RepID=UPI0024744A34|nr:glycosyltransferase [Kitasatospora sp. MAA4]MDH6132426.1 D-inositol-3-phosphate glycosyltransferase [Kitasatospora sp. MAA4]
MALTLDSAHIFFPRGGSAPMNRYLLGELERRGFTTRLHAGSLGRPGDPGHAPTFYGGLDVAAYDYNPAAAGFQNGESGQYHPELPFHPSYEDRGDVPDQMFSAVSPAAVENLTRAWTRHLLANRTTDTQLVHLHHLSYLQAAAGAAYSGIPTLTTLHGTELKQMEGMARHIALADRAEVSLLNLADQLHSANPRRTGRALIIAHRAGLNDADTAMLLNTPWEKWKYARTGLQALRTAVANAGRIVTVSEHDRSLAHRLLPLDGREVPVITNGVDTEVFTPRRMQDSDRMAQLRHWLITDPQGWAPGQPSGSIRYGDEALNRLWDRDGKLRPILLWVGRYLEFKAVPDLLKAFAIARAQLDPAPALVLWGGYPGECEGMHPMEIATDLGIQDDVYFVGWRGHDELPTGLNVADLMVAPAVNEPFGMVYLEAMACATPPICTATGGPAHTIIPDGDHATGWLVRPHDPSDLAEAIVRAVADPAERERRAANGRRHTLSTYRWASVADRYEEQYAQALDTAAV